MISVVVYMELGIVWSVKSCRMLVYCSLNYILKWCQLPAIFLV